MAPDTVTPRLRTANRDRCRLGLPQPGAPIPHQGISAVRFAQSLLHMSRARIDLQAAALEAQRTAPGDDVAWWEATMALDRALRRRGTGHQAAMAARLASQAVLAAATRTGLALSPDVTAVARSAGEVARVLTAADLDIPGAGYLARGWEDLLVPPADPSPSGSAGGRGPLRPPGAAHQPGRGRRT
jgi:hypothetical protein